MNQNFQPGAFNPNLFNRPHNPAQNQMPVFPVHINSNVLALLRMNAHQLTRADAVLKFSNASEEAKQKALRDLTESTSEYRGIVNTLSALFEPNFNTVPQTLVMNLNSSFQPPETAATQSWTQHLANDPWIHNKSTVPGVQIGQQMPVKASAEDLYYFLGKLSWLDYELSSFMQNFSKDLDKHPKVRFLVEKLHSEGIVKVSDIPRAIESQNSALKELVLYELSRFELFSYSEQYIAFLLFCLVYNENFKNNFKESAGKIILNKSLKTSVKNLLKNSPVVANTVFDGFCLDKASMPNVFGSLIILSDSEHKQFGSLLELVTFFNNSTSYIAKA